MSSSAIGSATRKNLTPFFFSREIASTVVINESGVGGSCLGIFSNSLSSLNRERALLDSLDDGKKASLKSSLLILGVVIAFLIFFFSYFGLLMCLHPKRMASGNISKSSLIVLERI